MHRLYPIGIFLIFAIIALTVIFYNRHDDGDSKPPQESLLIVWTSGEPDVAEKMVFMYTNAAKRQAWYDSVTLLIWGPSQKLLVSNEKLKENLESMRESDVRVIACRACADRYGLAGELETLGVEVFYTGEFLTKQLKSDSSDVLTF